MLDDVAAYLTIAPLAATLALTALAVVWLAPRRPAPRRVRYDR